MQNSAHIICLNEADAFLSPQDEKSKELIKTFIRFGYKGIVTKQSRVELLARHIPQGVKTGELHSVCSDASSEPRTIALRHSDF